MTECNRVPGNSRDRYIVAVKRSFAAKAIQSLLSVFKMWRCYIVYGDRRVQVLKRSPPRWFRNSLFFVV